MKVFFAGASGAIGQRLLPMLLERGYQVLAISRSEQRAAVLEAAGARAMVLDVYDADALHAAVQAFQPRWVIHQLTDLPPGLDPTLIAGRPAAQRARAPRGHREPGGGGPCRRGRAHGGAEHCLGLCAGRVAAA
jgi:Nucleoside-diphosphate-sugar epimerases